MRLVVIRNGKISPFVKLEIILLLLCFLFINNSDLNKVVILATKAESKAEQDKIINLQAYD